MNEKQVVILEAIDLIRKTWYGEKMKHLELLFKLNDVKSVKFKKSVLFYNNGILHIMIKSNGEMSGNQIWDLIVKVNYAIRRYPPNIPIAIHLGEIRFVDKLVYSFLECICYYVIHVLKRKVYIDITWSCTIWTEGINYSSLNCLTSSSRESYEAFEKRFVFDITDGHFRRIIRVDSKYEVVSKLMQDLRNFLRNANVCDSDVESLAEVIVELVGNAKEHGRSDCLVDVDVTKSDYTRTDDPNGELYYGMNVAIVSFSDILFHQLLYSRMKSMESFPDRYEVVRQASINHRKHFNDDYEERDFYIVSSFQNKISGMKDKVNTGGTGLTYLIHSLELNSDSNLCYMATGNRVFVFHKEFLQYNDDGWIGFNKIGDYSNAIPDLSCFSIGKTYIPGTAYNLGFVIRKV